MNLLFTALACLFSLSICGQTVNVTFQVDMNQFNEPFNYGNVYINSSFDGWCGGCRQMYNYNNDNIWSVTVPLSQGTYEYKFTLDGWTDQEWFEDGAICTTTIDGFVNRSVTVINEDIVLPIVCYSNCIPVLTQYLDALMNPQQIITHLQQMTICHVNLKTQMDLPVTQI